MVFRQPACSCYIHSFECGKAGCGCVLAYVCVRVGARTVQEGAFMYLPASLPQSLDTSAKEATGDGDCGEGGSAERSLRQLLVE